jgi:glycine/D-amino acid oxidase-like deaminating enzyme
MRVAVVGCGIVGAAIAFELSQVPGLKVTVLDAQQPAQACSRAALGVLMGVISQKPKGNNLQMRLFGIQQYNDWVPQLEAMTGRRILFNRQGILRLCFEDDDLDTWRSLASLRASQGWQLEIGDRAYLATHYPQLNLDGMVGAVYSPCDRQIDPTAITLALIEAAQHNGVSCQFDTPVTGIEANGLQLHTPAGSLDTDWLVIAAGLGSAPLTTQLQQTVDIRPVLGQAVRVKVPQSLGHPTLQPVITGNDVHLVPLGKNEYWIGATVEFPTPHSPLPDPAALEQMMQQAIAFCPALKQATRLQHWQGLRPRPEGRPAPIIEKLPGDSNVILASGHYRNGVLLAPATAKKVKDLILNEMSVS